MSESAPPPKRSWIERPLLFHGIFIGVLAVILVVLLVLTGAASRLKEVPPVYGHVPNFELTDDRGQPFADEDLKGKYTVANFIFTRCPGPCAALSRQFSEFQKQLSGRDDIRLLSVTVDPEFDQPDVLASYAEAYKAEPERWRFLTGEKKPVYELIGKGFKVVARENEDPNAPMESLFIHTTRIVLVDPDGAIRGYYDGVRPDEYERLMSDIGRLQ